jgi:hypothetical protein
MVFYYAGTVIFLIRGGRRRGRHAPVQLAEVPELRAVGRP